MNIPIIFVIMSAILLSIIISTLALAVVMFYRAKKSLATELKVVESELKNEQALKQEQIKSAYDDGFTKGYNNLALKKIGFTQERFDQLMNAEKGASYEKGKNDATDQTLKDFRVRVMPVYHLFEKKSFWSGDSLEADLGYQMQLFYRELPILEPAERILYKRYRVRSKQEAIEVANKLAQTAVMALSAIPPSIVAFQAL